MLPNQPAATANSFSSQAARLGGTALALGLFAAAMWFAWLGWDHEYYQVDGVSQGPYRAWQVFGCGLSIAAAAVLAYLRVRSVSEDVKAGETGSFSLDPPRLIS